MTERPRALELWQRKLVRVSTAAKRIGVSPRTVRRWIGRGILRGKKIAGHYYVHSDALEALLGPVAADKGTD